MHLYGRHRGRPGPKRAVALLPTVIDIEAPPKPLREWLVTVITTQGWARSRSEVEECAERWEAAALLELQHAISVPDKFGRPRLIMLNSSSAYLIQGAAFIEPNDDDLTKQHKNSRRYILRMWDALRSLNDREFEVCCTRILEEPGVTAPILTQFVADQGIDFYRKLRLVDFIQSGDLEPTIQTQFDIWMIGQAKNYQRTKVATPDIRELVGSVELAKARAFATDEGEKFVDLKIRPCDPIFQLFFTTGHISDDGWTFLASSGVIGMDGLMLSAFLSDRGIGLLNGDFNRDAFAKWMRH